MTPIYCPWCGLRLDERTVNVFQGAPYCEPHFQYMRGQATPEGAPTPSAPQSKPTADPGALAAATTGRVPPGSVEPVYSSRGTCIVLGILLLLVGVYFLVVSPSAGGAELLGRDIVNLQRVYVGQTAAICGSIFLAAGIRPRATW